MFRSPKDHPQGIRQALLKLPLRSMYYVGVLLEFLAFYCV